MILKLRNIYEKNKKKDINIIPNTKENYITFSVKVVVDLYKPWNGTHQKNSINGTLEYKCTPIKKLYFPTEIRFIKIFNKGE
jgi:hypothetical protein